MSSVPNSPAARNLPLGIWPVASANMEGTSEEVAKTKAREVHEPIQGYGAAIRRGFREVEGDLTIEPGGSLTLEPGGVHVMCMGPVAPLVAGDTLQVQLGFASGTELAVDIAVQSP